MRNLICYLVLLVLSVHSIFADVPQSEKKALIEFFGSTNGDGWKTKWDISTDVSKWHGVKVVADHVTEINLFRNNLIGTIPKSIGNLKNLVSLNLAFNSLTGELPEEMVELTKLRVLKIEINRFRGELPKGLGNLKSLVELTAFNNFLTGSIPESIGEIKGLKILILSSNSLKGSIPKSVGSLASLETLGLFENTLEGSIPAEMGNLANLKELVLIYVSEIIRSPSPKQIKKDQIFLAVQHLIPVFIFPSRFHFCKIIKEIGLKKTLGPKLNFTKFFCSMSFPICHLSFS